ncbi:hypothetical protein R3P38DRAFT_2663006 [Favolaschia claudopus]|uniref:Uncharacterized protein n=1 Tax=Favolaschia claudopus TaxID=2862362 RepID=A0AAV9ZJ51_9AGAR
MDRRQSSTTNSSTNSPLAPSTIDSVHPQPQKPAKRHSLLSISISHLTTSQLKIIGSQVALHSAAWAFFIVIWRKHVIPLPFDLSDDRQTWLKPVTFVITAISSGLALISTWMFSLAVREWITSHLRGPEGLPLHRFLRGMAIASRSPIRDCKQPGWMLLSLGVALLAAVQPAGFNTLLTPTLFDYRTQVSNSEVDLSSSAIQSYFASGALNGCVFNDSLLIALGVGQTESGYAAVKGNEKFPSSTTLLNFDFNTSTAGILPMTFTPIDASPWFQNATILPQTISEPLEDGTPRLLSISQQGFSADVSCKSQNLGAGTTPSLTIATTPPSASGGPTQYTVSSTCASPENFFNVLDVDQTSIYGFQDYLTMIACPGTDQNSYTLIFIGDGLYFWLNSTVCTFSPKVTNVMVEYLYTGSKRNLSNTITPNTLPGRGSPDVGRPAGVSSVVTLFNMVQIAQGDTSNIVGDQLLAGLEALDGAGFQYNAGTGPDIMRALEEYIRGVAEYSGSILRACLSSHKSGGAFPDGPPKNTLITSRGWLQSYFFGWAITLSTTWILVPGTIIAVATIILVYKAGIAAPAASDAASTSKLPFDPANPSDLVIASAAGGLAGAFAEAPMEEVHRKREAKDVRIVLGDISGRGMGLKRKI